MTVESAGAQLAQRDGWVVCPDWPAPANIRAMTTTRRYGDLALAPPGPDACSKQSVIDERLSRALDLPARPSWLRQVHGIHVVQAEDVSTDTRADACVARRPEQVCAVLTADCVPVLLCEPDTGRVAAAHAGWRGLSAGILEATVAAMGTPARGILAWLGPAIGVDAFEVGGEVRDAFLSADPRAGSAFRAKSTAKWQADLFELSRQRLRRAGIDRVYGGGACTYSDSERFFSHRRDRTPERMASLIWRMTND